MECCFWWLSGAGPPLVDPATVSRHRPVRPPPLPGTPDRGPRGIRRLVMGSDHGGRWSHLIWTIGRKEGWSLSKDRGEPNET